MKNYVIAALSLIALAGCNEENNMGGTVSSTQSNASYMNIIWPVASEDTQPVTGQMDIDMFRENYMVVLDMSGSMSESSCAGEYDTKRDAAVDVLTKWTEMVDTDAAIGLVVFDRNGVYTALDVSPNNHKNFISALSSLSADGGTPLSAAVAEGYRGLERRAFLQNGAGAYKMVVVTDGIHSTGYNPTANVEWIIANTPIEMHTIGFCIDESALNQPGKTIYTSAENPEKLFTGLSNALAEVPSFNLTTFE